MVFFAQESFLSDQPASLLGFFEIFLETALFNKLIESKFGEKLGTVSPSLEYFEECVRKATSRSDGTYIQDFVAKFLFDEDIKLKVKIAHS